MFFFLGSQSLLIILHYYPISPCIQQPCPAVRPISTGFDARARSLRSHRTSCTTVAGHQTACARCCPDRFKLVFSPISPCFHYVSPNSPALRSNISQTALVAALDTYNFIVFLVIIYYALQITFRLRPVQIAAPRLRPLFKDKQIVEGSDSCGLFVDNFFF
jgi:hypothetical protein